MISPNMIDPSVLAKFGGASAMPTPGAIPSADGGNSGMLQMLMSLMGKQQQNGQAQQQAPQQAPYQVGNMTAPVTTNRNYGDIVKQSMTLGR